MVKSSGLSILKEPRTSRFTSELKFVDTTVTSAVAVAGTWTKLGFPTQGSTSSTRVGDRCRIVAIEQIGIFFANALDYSRMIVLQTKGLFTSAPATTDVLQFAGPTSPIAYNASNLYNIVTDKFLTLVPGGDSQVSKVNKTYKVHIPELRFVPGSVNVYDGQVYILFITQNALTTSVNITFRLWYEDGN